jgi:hypothetical protein
MINAQGWLLHYRVFKPGTFLQEGKQSFVFRQSPKGIWIRRFGAGMGSN